MRKIKILFFALFIAAYSAQAQTGAVIEFKETTHDFGSINEEKGPVSHEFIFTNKGTEPLIISNVQASCGCTTPGWTKDPVLPGKSGFIKAEFNPLNRPGTVHKTLTVTANTEPATSILTIKGNVIPKPKTPADEYPIKKGSIRFNNDYLAFGSINTKEPVTKEFTIYNDSDAPVTFNSHAEHPKHIKVSVTPAVIQPKEKGTLKVIYDAKSKNDFGYLIDQIELKTNEAVDNKKQLYVVATVNEYFPPMTEEELAKAPKLSFTTTEHDFGTVKQGETVTTEFELTNTGKHDLVIRKVKAGCSCITGQAEKTVIKPGDKTKIKVTLNSKTLEGQESKAVTVYCNDPSAPSHMLKVNANVTK